MSENYYAGVYWPSRKESAEACAQRAAALFQGLSALDPSWADWFGTGKTREQALEKRLPLVASTFEQLFSMKKHQLVSGFSFVAWNGEANGSATGVITTCGVDSAYLSNVCTVNPLRGGPIAERLHDSTVMSRTLQAMALAWEPEWGVATSDLHRDEVLKTAKPGTFVGWVMYFSHRRGTVPSLPAPVRIEPVGDKGTLVILTPERFTASNPEHVALAARVHELLDRASLLRPLQQWEPARLVATVTLAPPTPPSVIDAPGLIGDLYRVALGTCRHLARATKGSGPLPL